MWTTQLWVDRSHDHRPYPFFCTCPICDARWRQGLQPVTSRSAWSSLGTYSNLGGLGSICTSISSGQLFKASSGLRYHTGKRVPWFLFPYWSFYKVNIVGWRNHYFALDLTGQTKLKRHGARFPTQGASKQILSALDKLQSATSYTHPNLKFLKDFTYDLGTADLVPFGALQ